MTTARTAGSAAPTERADTWSEHAYHALRRNILSGDLAPGSRLKIEQLREEYGVGPTPLREALSRLSSEGLVLIEQLRGFRVAPVGVKELRELCDLRVLIEAEALRRSTLIGDEHWEGQIIAAYHKLSRLHARRERGEEIAADDWEDRNREFHDALVAAADSDWLLRLRGQLFDHHERYRRRGRALLRLTPARDVDAEHRGIMEAALARDGAEAGRLMGEHIRGSMDLLLDRLEP